MVYFKAALKFNILSRENKIFPFLNYCTPFAFFASEIWISLVSGSIRIILLHRPVMNFQAWVNSSSSLHFKQLKNCKFFQLSKSSLVKFVGTTWVPTSSSLTSFVFSIYFVIPNILYIFPSTLTSLIPFIFSISPS